jgi:CheY-like chemotaxis protein
VAKAQPFVLIVDDEAPIRVLARRFLEELGWGVFEAANGAEALLVLQQLDHIDLLVTDVHMPELSGTGLAAMVRAHRRGIKILYLTGYPERVFESTAVLPPTEAFLAKPFTRTDIQQAASLLVFGTVKPPT